MLSTTFSKLFGVEHPIVCRWGGAAGSAELVAAAAQAGALGFLAVPAVVTPEELLREIARCRELTDRPFGLDLTPMPDQWKPPEALNDVLAGAGNAAVLAGPALGLPALQAAGIKVVRGLSTCGGAGDLPDADAVLVDGFGRARRTGAGELERSVPIIIAGARPADGRDLVAALALGASAITVTLPQDASVSAASSAETIARIVGEAEDIITGRLADLVTLPGFESANRRAEPASETMLKSALESAWEAAP